MTCRAFSKPLPTGITRATTEHMPFKAHRNCSQWGHPARQMSYAERKREAERGSAQLRDAILKAANG